MARLVLKDNITSGGVLALGQTLRLGGFTMITRSAVEPTMTSRAIENFCRRHSGTLNESTNVGVKTGESRVGGPELCV